MMLHSKATTWVSWWEWLIKISVGRTATTKRHSCIAAALTYEIWLKEVFADLVFLWVAFSYSFDLFYLVLCVSVHGRSWGLLSSVALDADWQSLLVPSLVIFWAMMMAWGAAGGVGVSLASGLL
ncbi:hypothetical protein Dimus_031214 [Dionaea muscipula]